MLDSDLILFIVKLIAGGIIAFLAIMLWSKTRNPCWMNLVAGAVFGYASIILELLIRLGIATSDKIPFFGFGLQGVRILITCVTALFIIVAFVMMLSGAYKDSENV